MLLHGRPAAVATPAATAGAAPIVLPKRRLTQTEQFRLLARIERQQTEARHAAAEQQRRAAQAQRAAAAQSATSGDEAATAGQTARDVREYQQQPSTCSRFHQVEAPLVAPALVGAAAAVTDTRTHRQHLEQYATTRQLTWKTECECTEMLCEGMQLLNEQRRINSLLRNLLFQCAPTGVIPLSCGAFCHLLDDDPHYLASSTARQPSDVVDRLDKSNVIDACQLRSDFLARYLTGSDAAPPARSPSPNYSDSDCCVCWSELRQGTCTLYKMICCGRLVHLDCVKQVSERKSTSERRECVACYAELDADEFESIKEEIQLRRQRERFPTQAKARARAAKEGVKPSMEPDEEKKQAELQESSSSEEDDYEPPVTRSGKRQKTSATTMREVKTPARHRVTADPKPSAAAAAAAGAPAVDRAASHQKRLERQAENFGYLNAARHSRRQQLAGRLAAKLPSATAKLKVSTTSVGAAASSSAAPSAAAAEPHAAKLARLQAEVDRLVTVWMGVHVCKSVQEEDDEFDLEARAQAALDALRLPDPSFDDESPSEEQNDSAEGEKRYDRLHFEFSLGDAPVINMPLVSQTLVTPSSSLLQPSSNESRSVVTTALPPSLPPRPFYPPSEASTPMELCSP